MSEKKLQAKIVMSFSQERPNEKGLLWSTRNTTFSMKDGQTQKALGMVAGVSDLIYFNNGLLIGIEVKEPGSIHSSDHIYQQYKWGRNISMNGGKYFIVTSEDEFWYIINHEYIKVIHDIYHIKERLDLDKKTMTF